MEPAPVAEPESTPQPILVAVLSRRRHWQLRALVAVWLATVIVFYSWWFRDDHVVGWLKYGVNTLIVT